MNLLISLVWAAAALGALGAGAGMMAASLFTLDPRLVQLGAKVGCAVFPLAGIAAAVISQVRGGRMPLYARGVMHGYVLGIPELEFGCLTTAVLIAGAVALPWLRRPEAPFYLRWTTAALLAAAAVAAGVARSKRKL